MSDFPPRCFTCGKVIGNLLDNYLSRVKSGEEPQQALDEMKIGKMCCRRMFMTHVGFDRINKMYPTFTDRIQYVGLKRILDVDDAE